jgi:hypothetical protein
MSLDRFGLGQLETTAPIDTCAIDRDGIRDPGLIFHIERQHGQQQRKLGTTPLAYRLVQRLSEL